jgi:hypothetical protein
MKPLLFIFVFIISQTSTLAQSKKEVRNYGISSAVETRILYKNGIEIKRFIKEKRAWNKNGRLILEEQYSKNGEIQSRETFIWNKDVLIEETLENFSKEKSAKQEFIKRTYSIKKKKVTEEKLFNKQNELIGRIAYSYNRFGDKTEELEYSASSELLKRISYLYNKKGLKIEKSEFDSQGNITEKTLYEYLF